MLFLDKITKEETPNTKPIQSNQTGIVKNERAATPLKKATRL